MSSPTSIKVGHAAECLQLVQERTKGVLVNKSGSDASICVLLSRTLGDLFI